MPPHVEPLHVVVPGSSGALRDWGEHCAKEWGGTIVTGP